MQALRISTGAGGFPQGGSANPPRPERGKTAPKNTFLTLQNSATAVVQTAHRIMDETVDLKILSGGS